MSLRPLPERLEARGMRTLRQLDLPNLDDSGIAAATRVFGLSEFARTAAARQREWLGEALAEHGFSRPATRADLQRELAAQTAGVSNPTGLQRALRIVRQRQQLWLVWRHLAGGAALEEGDIEAVVAPLAVEQSDELLQAGDPGPRTEAAGQPEAEEHGAGDAVEHGGVAHQDAELPLGSLGGFVGQIMVISEQSDW